MDALTHHDPAPDASAIETAARDMGIIPGDPAYGFVQFMIRSAEADTLARKAHVATLAQMLDRAEKQAGGQLARTAAFELPGAVDRLVLIRFWWLVALAMLGVVALAGLAFGAGWFWRATEVENVTVSGCVPSPQQSGQAFTCTFWTRPPPPGAH
jgi:hypothetical protein